MRSALLISRTLVSKEPWRVRALHLSFASRNARPNSLERNDVRGQTQIDYAPKLTFS